MVSLVSPERPDTEAHIFEEIRKKAAEADRESIKVGVEEKGDLGGGRHRGAGGFNSSHCPKATSSRRRKRCSKIWRSMLRDELTQRMKLEK